jgi:hypothetical protein
MTRAPHRSTVRCGAGCGDPGQGLATLHGIRTRVHIPFAPGPRPRARGRASPAACRTAWSARWRRAAGRHKKTITFLLINYWDEISIRPSAAGRAFLAGLHVNIVKALLPPNSASARQRRSRRPPMPRAHQRNHAADSIVRSLRTVAAVALPGKRAGCVPRLPRDRGLRPDLPPATAA